MEGFLTGKGGDLGKALNAAVEEFRNPTEKKGSGPVAVMFTDIVGSTKLTQQLGDTGAQNLVRLHNTVVRNALREFRGTEVKHTGDGIMASFVSCPEAVGAGIAIQRALNTQRVKDPSILLHLRVGINAGEPIAENGDLFGTTVQLAARICDKAGTDGVYVSQVVKDLPQGRGVFENKGTFELKGVSEPQTLYNVVIPG
jgi:class 3 adenylate cyclase